MSFRGRWLLVTACLVAVSGGVGRRATRVEAQSRKSTITGRVTVQGSTPVAGARISVVNLHKSTTTDSVGRFAFPGLGRGQYLVEARVIGYAPLSAVVLIDENEQKDIEFRTDSAGRLLPTIFVEGEEQPDLILSSTLGS